ncbi:MAG: hypothetical protein M3474_04345 [Actinomycetota bacterium]|nr:hypothetical protein [Actinomycetota bacterium]
MPCAWAEPGRSIHRLVLVTRGCLGQVAGHVGDRLVLAGDEQLGLIAEPLDRPIRRQQDQLVGQVRLLAGQVEDPVGSGAAPDEGDVADPVVLQ